MTDDTSPPDEPRDDRDRRDEDRIGDRDGPADGWLSSLLHALERFEEMSRADGSRRTNLDYDVSVRSLDSLTDRGDRAASGDRTTDRSGLAGRPRSTREWPSASKYNVAVRRYDDEVIVTADLSDVDRDDVTVGFDNETLVVGVEGREIERLAVPWTASTADATVRNGVLTVHVRPDTDE